MIIGTRESMPEIKLEYFHAVMWRPSNSPFVRIAMMMFVSLMNLISYIVSRNRPSTEQQFLLLISISIAASLEHDWKVDLAFGVVETNFSI
jgi:hypothetical protein